MFLPPAYVVRRKIMFSLRLSVHPWWSQVPSQPLIPCSFGGGVPQPLVPYRGWWGEVPQDRGTSLARDRTGVPPAGQDWGPASPPHQDRTGTPSLDRTGVPPPGTGLHRRWHASCGFPQDFLVDIYSIFNGTNLPKNTLSRSLCSFIIGVAITETKLQNVHLKK